MGEVDLCSSVGWPAHAGQFQWTPLFIREPGLQREIHRPGRGCGPLDQLWWRQDLALYLKAMMTSSTGQELQCLLTTAHMPSILS